MNEEHLYWELLELRRRKMSDQSRKAIDECIAVVIEYLTEEQIEHGRKLVPTTPLTPD